MGTRINNLEVDREDSQEALLRVHDMDLESKCCDLVHFLAWVDCAGWDLSGVSLPPVRGFE